jgi:hypothetical protein
MTEPVRAGREGPPQSAAVQLPATGSARLADLAAQARRVALVGLAKNTGKTVALGAILAELEDDGRCVGVTSVGRDGEEHDVIDIRIEKPPIRLSAGSIVASTDSLLRAAGAPFELLANTQIRTPLGSVQIARLLGAATIEVAGPSAAEDVRAVCEQMLAHGAEQVLIDGAIDRRAASSPQVSDGLIMSTGAALSDDIEVLVRETRAAVDLVNLSQLEDPALRELALSHTGSLLIDAHGQRVTLPAGFALSATEQEIAQLLRENPEPRLLLIAGALCEPLLGGLARGLKGSRLDIVVGDTTKVFLTQRPLEFYRRHGLNILALHPVTLLALTVNPVAPGAHRFDSDQLRGLLAEQIPGLPVIDVLSPAYSAAAARQP